MALFRKLFYRKPPDGLLEISERVYVFDCCFTTDAWEVHDYKGYAGNIITQLREHYPDSSILLFNFRDGETQSMIANALSDYDLTIMEYPRHYEGCPLLTMEVIHHFLRSSESWLSLGLQNLLLMHCERGGWPVLAFMLSALLIYRKQYSGEQKTLEMVYRQAPRELLHFLSPLNPIPSQLRYLQYVSRRNVGTEWPPLDRALTVDCVIIRMIPNFDGVGGCRPIFRLYGQDPFLVSDRAPKVLFSTPKKSRTVRHYKQAECELVKIDINCHIQGDVVLECISLYDDMEREEMMFRVMFNTAFIRSNILMLNRDEIDILWDAKDRFPKDFRAEVIFSEMDAEAPIVPMDFSFLEEKDGLPVEAFARVQEIFSNVDWVVQKGDSTGAEVLQHIAISSNTGNEAVSNAEKLQQIQSAAASEYDVRSSTEITPESKSSPRTPFTIIIRTPKDTDSDSGRSPETSPSRFSPRLEDKVSVQNKSKLQLQTPDEPINQTPIRRDRVIRDEPGRPSLAPPTTASSTEDMVKVTKVTPPPTRFSSTAGVSTSTRVETLQTPTPTPLPSSSKEDATHKIAAPIISSPDESPPPPPPSLPQEEKSAGKDKHPTLAPVPFPLPSIDDSARKPAPGPPPSPSPHLTPRLTDGSALRPAPPPQEEKPAGKDEHPTLAPVSFPLPSIDDSARKPAPGPPPSPSPYLTPPLTDGSALKPPPPPQEEKSAGKDKHPSLAAVPFPSLSIDDSTRKPTPGPPSSPPLPLTPPLTDGSAIRHVPPPPPPPVTPPLRDDSRRRPATSPPHSAVTPPLVDGSAPRPPPPPPVPLNENLSITGTLLRVPPPPPPPLPVTPLKEQTSPEVVFAPPLTPPLKDTNPTRPAPPPPPPVPPRDDSCAEGTPPLPPPPPLPMSQDNSSVRGAPPLPPPPPLPSENGAGPNSSVGAPPPPPPSNLGSNSLSGPSPPPPMGAKGKSLLSRTVTSRNNQAKKLKPLHWLKLSRAVSGSLWAEAQKSGDATKAPEIDYSELESLFSAATTNLDSGRKAGSRASVAPKPEKVQLIDHRRAYNCEIMLSKVKIPLHELLSSVLALEDTALDIDQVENVIKFCPTKEEMELLKGYKGDKEKLGKCEQFFLELMQVPRIESKLKVFSFKIQFSSQLTDLRNSLKVANSAADQIRGSAKLKRIMQTILSLGNALNQGTARGSAIGFRLDSLLKLTDTRARNNKMTLMHYLCKVLADKLPELLDFWEDLSSLERASKIQLKYLAEEMQAINKGLEKVVQELAMSENDGPVSDRFRLALKDFLCYSESEVRTLASVYSGVGRNVDALILYFGEDPARCPFEQVISTLLNFVRMFKKAHEENCKQLELDKKKAEKEASNEKQKINASDTGNLLQSQVRSVK